MGGWMMNCIGKRERGKERKRKREKGEEGKRERPAVVFFLCVTLLAVS
jgi:hypothetical protein